MLEYKHDFRKVDKAVGFLHLARRRLAAGLTDSAQVSIEDALQALLGYVYRENVIPVEDGENGWVKMDDALQLTFTREQLKCIRDLFGERLREFPGSKLALAHLGIINRCQELLDCPCFDNVQEFVANNSGNWSLISSRV